MRMYLLLCVLRKMEFVFGANIYLSCFGSTNLTASCFWTRLFAWKVLVAMYANEIELHKSQFEGDQITKSVKCLAVVLLKQPICLRNSNEP